MSKYRYYSKISEIKRGDLKCSVLSIFYKRIIRKYFRCTLMKLNRKHVAAHVVAY